MGFPRQEYRSDLPCRPPDNLPDPGIEPASLMSPALAGGFFTTSATWTDLEMIQLQSWERRPKKIFEFFSLKKYFYLFLAHWVSVALCGLSLVVVGGGYSVQCLSHCRARALERVGFSSCGPGHVGLVPGSGIKPVSLALAEWNLNHWTTREVPNSFVLYVT